MRCSMPKLLNLFLYLSFSCLNKSKMSDHSSVNSYSPPHTPNSVLPTQHYTSFHPIPYEPMYATAHNPFISNFNQSPVLVEKGLNFRKADNWAFTRIEEDGWDYFCRAPRGKINVTIAREFYSALSEANTVASIQSVTVRGIVVPFTSATINQIFFIPPVQTSPVSHFEFQWRLDTADGYFTKCSEAYPLMFNNYNNDQNDSASALLPHLINWKRFINSRVYPTEDFSEVSCDELLLLYAIVSGAIIDWGILIQKAAVSYAFGRIPIRQPMPFAWLISRLCVRLARVPVRSTDEVLPARHSQNGLLPVDIPGGTSSGED